MPHTTTATKIRVGLYVRLEAKPGQENAVAAFLKSALPLVEREPATMTWYAMRLGPTTFGIYDTFPDDQGREAHLAGDVATAPAISAAPPARMVVCSRMGQLRGNSVTAPRASAGSPRPDGQRMPEHVPRIPARLDPLEARVVRLAALVERRNDGDSLPAQAHGRGRARAPVGFPAR